MFNLPKTSPDPQVRTQEDERHDWIVDRAQVLLHEPAFRLQAMIDHILDVVELSEESTLAQGLLVFLGALDVHMVLARNRLESVIKEAAKAAAGLEFESTIVRHEGPTEDELTRHPREL